MPDPDPIADAFKHAATRNELGRVDFKEITADGRAVFTGRYEDNYRNIQTQQYQIDQSTLQQRAQNALFETENPYYRHNITQYSNASQAMNNFNHTVQNDRVGDIIRRDNIQIAANPSFFQ